MLLLPPHAPACLCRLRASTWVMTSRRRSGGRAPSTDLSIWENVIWVGLGCEAEVPVREGEGKEICQRSQNKQKQQERYPTPEVYRS